jgi:hypothetical protein
MAPLSSELSVDHLKPSLVECRGTAGAAQGLACSGYPLTPVFGRTDELQVLL